MLESIILDSPEDCESDAELLEPHYDVPHTPSSTSDEAPQPPRGGRDVTGDVDSDEGESGYDHGELVPRRKPGGYDSRVEQILYENPELPILIIDAGKSLESGGKPIVYTIRTAVC